MLTAELDIVGPPKETNVQFLALASAVVFSAAAAAQTPTPSGPHLIPLVKRANASGFRFRDLEGRRFTVADFRGKLVVVELWATWCEPCLMQLPEIAALQKATNDGRPLAVVPIQTDKKGWVAVQPFLHKSGLYEQGFRTYAAEAGGIQVSFGPIHGLPTTILIDAQGNVAARWTGYRSHNPLKPLLVELSHELPAYAP